MASSVLCFVTKPCRVFRVSAFNNLGRDLVGLTVPRADDRHLAHRAAARVELLQLVLVLFLTSHERFVHFDRTGEDFALIG